MIRFSMIPVFSLLLFCSAGFLAAAEDRDPSASEELADSLKVWRKLNKEHEGNYSYKVRFSSFSGAGNETTIVVRDNKVTERRFRSWTDRPAPPAPGKKPKEDDSKGDSWVEKGDDIGSHKEGAPARTMEELYEIAAEVASSKLKDHEKRYLRFNDDGILESCFTIDTRIADDAPRKGIAITGLKLGSGKIYKAPNGKAFPAHWGAPPRLQTRDLRELPGGYGRGSGTLARWIQENLDRDAASKDEA